MAELKKVTSIREYRDGKLVYREIAVVRWTEKPDNPSKPPTEVKGIHEN